ncbi:GDP-mannose 4,6-dehydratase [Methanobacterium sp. MBAC-LM]|uniref:GDP-mannose 4,6-dehydratase n=1 Tax=Methanobacterium sp. MBAC-LM TaxID=3412034 RepID=UPI003C78ECDB
MNWKGKNVLITGIGGFVGPYLGEALLEKEAIVFGLVRKRADGLKTKSLEDKGIENDVKLIGGDLTDITSLANALDVADPDFIFHLAAQSFVPRSFENSLETQQINCIGTVNLLDAVKMKDIDSKIVFAGSSEEYGLVISSSNHHEQAQKKHRSIFPEVENIPEVPIKETNPLRPMSPYAVSKVYGDFLMRNYYHSYGMDNVVSRAFNHEGAGRGPMFVTSVIANQIMKLKFGEISKINIGNVNAFRDWSHVKDIIKGYMLLAENGKNGEVYNQGSMRTNSVLSYILLSLKEAGWNINKIETFNREKMIKEPVSMDHSKIFGVGFEKTVVDQMILEGELEYTIADKGIYAHTDKGEIAVEFNPERFRPAEVPILFANTEKIQKLGAKIEYKLNHIIKDQLNYYLKKENRVLF